MTTYEIIVTDVTCYGDLYCVAGWDSARGMMIRPEPSTATLYEASRFWSGQNAGPGKFFSLGNKVRFEAADPPAAFPFPHANEDRVLIADQPSRVLSHLSLADVAQSVAASVSPSLNAVFGQQLVRAASSKAYVPAGANVPSLGAVELAPNQIAFYVDSFNQQKPRLRARIQDAGVLFDLSVPADSARTIWKTEGLDALHGKLHDCQRVHVRVGLSRPFNAMPDQCYSQVNGLYFL